MLYVRKEMEGQRKDCIYLERWLLAGSRQKGWERRMTVSAVTLRHLAAANQNKCAQEGQTQVQGKGWIWLKPC